MFDLDDFEYKTVETFSGGPVDRVVRLSAHVYKSGWAVIIADEHFYVGMVGDDGYYYSVPGLACHSLDDTVALVGELCGDLPEFKRHIDSGRLLLKDDRKKLLCDLLEVFKDDDRVCKQVLRQDASQLLAAIERRRSQ